MDKMVSTKYSIGDTVYVVKNTEDKFPVPESVKMVVRDIGFTYTAKEDILSIVYKLQLGKKDKWLEKVEDSIFNSEADAKEDANKRYRGYLEASYESAKRIVNDYENGTSKSTEK